MRVAAAVPEIEEYNIKANSETVLGFIKEASQLNIDLLLFPEAVLTGLVISDNYNTDKEYAITLDSEYITIISDYTRISKIWVAFGFIEVDNGVLYDSAILLNNNGEVVLHQRRLSTGWCNTNANPNEYGYGNNYNTVVTPWGKVGFMLCGDMFNVPHYAKNENLDILLFPFARSFSDWVTSPPQDEWDYTEWPEYAKQIKVIGAAVTIGANYIAPKEGSKFGGGFGGGFITDYNGKLLASQLLNKTGLLIYNMKERVSHEPKK